MATLTQLIEQYCPDGVEYVKLGDVASNLDRLRKPVTAKDRIPGPYPYYGANGIQDWVDDYLFEGDFVLLGEDGSVIHEDGTPFVHWAAGKIWVNNHAHILTVLDAQLSLRFLFHALKNTDVSNFITGGTQLKINQKNLNRIPIPLPPREVQDAIVERLDAFAALIKNLDSEVALREKRFEYFREQLLTFYESDGVEYVRLGDVAEVGTGKCDRKNATDDGEYPFFVRSEQVLRYSTYQFDEEAIIVPGEGGIGEIFHYINGKYALHQRAYRVHFIDEGVSARYALYAFKSFFKNYVMGRAVTATVTSLRKPMFTEFQFPLPALEVQQEIVDKLDMMQALIDNLKHERELRRAQFEYYREKLLTFNS